MLALKPGLFPLPLPCCLLFLQPAFHSGFNSLQTLPNGFLTWGPRHAQASHCFPEISRTPWTQKGGSFSHTLPSLPRLSCAPQARSSVGRGVNPPLWG